MCNAAILVRSVFNDKNKCCPQVFLEEYLNKYWNLILLFLFLYDISAAKFDRKEYYEKNKEEIKKSMHTIDIT